VELQELMQVALLLVAWITAFLLGRELQIGYAQWRARRRSQE
jgi:hypothetical protein